MIGGRDLLRPADIARLAGVDSSTVANWRRRHDDFPPPAEGTNSLFDREAIVAWLRTRDSTVDLGPLGAMRAAGVLDPAPLALEIAALAAVLDRADGLICDESIPDDLIEAIRDRSSVVSFAVLLEKIIRLAQRRWTTSGSTSVPLFPLLSGTTSSEVAFGLVREMIPRFMGVDRWAILAPELGPPSGFAKFVLDTVPLPAIGHVIDLAAGSGDTALEAGARYPGLDIIAIADTDDDVRSVGLRAIVRGIKVRVLVGDLATAEALATSTAPDVILVSSIGRVGNASVRSYEGGLLAERDFSLAALLAATKWLAFGGIAAIATDQRSVSDLPGYLLTARDMVVRSGQTAAIVALPIAFRDTPPILWIICSPESASSEVTMVDARTVSPSNPLELEEVQHAARFGWAEDLLGDDDDYVQGRDYDAWNNSDRAASVWSKDLVGSNATLEPGFWAPPEGQSDWSGYGDFYHAKVEELIPELALVFAPLGEPFQSFRSPTEIADPARLRLKDLTESGAISLVRGTSGEDDQRALRRVDFLRLAEFGHVLLTSRDEPLKDGIARVGDVVLAEIDGALRAVVIEKETLPAGQGIRVDRSMWVLKIRDEALDPLYLAMTINSPWARRISRLVDRDSRNDPLRIEIALISIEDQHELGAEYRRLTHMSARVRNLASNFEELVELFAGRVAHGGVRIFGPY